MIIIINILISLVVSSGLGEIVVAIVVKFKTIKFVFFLNQNFISRVITIITMVW